jgi:hypothetical protein
LRAAAILNRSPATASAGNMTLIYDSAGLPGSITATPMSTTPGFPSVLGPKTHI